jgi:pantoate--beta-alanine ligase
MTNGLPALVRLPNLAGMRVINSVRSMRQTALRWRRAGARIGFVPTMGCLHAGHISLVERARREAGPRGKVVVSIYVNPAQFGPKEDFTRYPRDLKRDLRLCRAAGVDAVFAPADEEMYPGKAGGRFSTCVVEEQLAQVMEGRSRPGHFRGVTTIVAKLFNCVLPDVAVFGAKDWQQAAIVKRMVADLNFPLEITVAPTLREVDGLAMSSRNKYLDAEQRAQAAILFRALNEARAAVRRGPQPATKLKQRLVRLIATQPAAKLDYVELFNPETLVAVRTARRGTHLALAVFLGKTRLIDNGAL